MKRLLTALIVFALLMSTFTVTQAYLGGCVMSLPFNEGTGATAYDETGNGNNGAITNATWTTGQYGAALSFDGTDDYITVSDSSELNPTDALTVAVWAKSNEATFSSWLKPVEKGAFDEDGYGLHGVLNSNAYRFSVYYNGTEYYVDSDTLTVTMWHHIVGVYSDGAISIYVDGEFENSTSAVLGASSRVLRVGCASAGGEYWNGIIDEVQVYECALSEYEILSLYGASEDVVVIGEEVSTFYLRSDTYTVNNETGYGLDSSNTASSATVSQSSVTDTIYYGFRVYLLNQQGYTRELTSGTPVGQVTRSSNGSGVQTNTYSFAGTTLTASAEALLIKVYTKVGASGTWAVKATYLSNQILAREIEESTWTFALYTNKTGETASFSFGSSSAESKVSGLSMVEPDLFGYAMHYFRTGDWVMFFAYPYTRLIGMTPLTSIVLFGIGLTVYVRFRNFYFLLLVMVMLSIGGVLQFVLGGDWLMGIVALICTFALGALYWKVFR